MWSAQADLGSFRDSIKVHFLLKENRFRKDSSSLIRCIRQKVENCDKAMLITQKFN